MENKDLEWRMYGLVPYNISPIQQGIQYGHALQEYNNMVLELATGKTGGPFYGDTIDAFSKWRSTDKTFIILNGGTTNETRELGSGKAVGTMQQHLDTLTENNIVNATFKEPDLNDTLTGIVFLVDERVFDKEKYPDYDETILETPYDEYCEIIGGEKNLFLREFLSQFRLA
jgi:hypothetical protein